MKGNKMNKYGAEMVGTCVLLFIGCGTVVMAMIYAVGPVSGAHLNPAVTMAVFAAGRMKVRDVFGYIIFQIIGALLACSLITLIRNISFRC